MISGALAGSYYYYFLIPEKVERKLLESIHSLGFEAFSFEAISKDREKITLRNVVLDKDNFSTIDEIVINFSLSQIFKSDQARSIHINGMKLTGSIDEEKYDVTLDGFGKNSVLLDNINQLPAQSIIINDGRVDLMTDSFGGLTFNYQAELDRQADNSFDIVSKISTQQNKVGFHGKLTGAISSSSQYDFEAELEQLSLSLPHIRIRRGLAKIKNSSNKPTEFLVKPQFPSMVWNDFPLANISGDLIFSPQKHNANLNGSTFGENSISWGISTTLKDGVYSSDAVLKSEVFGHILDFFYSNKNLTSPLLPSALSGLKDPVLNIRSEFKNGIIDGSLNFKSVDFKPNLNLSFDSDNSNSSINGRLSDFTIQIKALNKKLIIPASFNLEYKLSDFWNDSELNIELSTKIENGTLDLGILDIGNISGNIAYGTGDKKQDIHLLDFKLPLRSDVKHTGKLAVSLYGDSHFEILRGIFGIYGGSIRAEKPLFKNNDVIYKNSLTVASIDLEPLFEDLGFDNIDVSGLFGGVIPIVIEDNALKANGAILQSENSGVIKLPEDVASSLFPGDSARLIKIRESLKNFHYEFFETRFDGDLNGRVLMTLKAKGRNPDLQDKDPVDLNLQIETKISSVLKRLLQ